jgi:serine protease Do
MLRPPIAYRLLVLAVLAASFALSCDRAPTSSLPPSRESAAERSGAAIPTSSPAALPNFSVLVDRYGPAVVNVSVAQHVKAERQDQETPRPDPDDPLWQFFRRFGGSLPRRDVPVRGEGSGFIVSPDGTILTSAHVVDGADEVTVKLTDRREFRARVVGEDRLSDVAVIKIDARNLPTAPLGNSSRLRVGDWVVAIGSPFGFENTVTAGIVSAKSRWLPGEAHGPFIQTDVPVNPGNSGGPLFNAEGQVVGINSQIYSETGGFMGLSFATPIDVAVKAADQLRRYGHVTRGRLGIAIQDVNQPLADSFGLHAPQGALVSAVELNSPAARAGLEPGDVILDAGGKHIDRSADLSGLIAELKPGTVTSIRIWRAGRAQDLKVTVGAFPDIPTASAGSRAP